MLQKTQWSQKLFLSFLLEICLLVHLTWFLTKKSRDDNESFNRNLTS
jgi:hypothetical protein